MKLTALKDICRRYDIALVYLFGSCRETAYRFLHGEKINLDDPLTDLDIGVVFRKSLPPAAERYKLYTEIWHDLADLFSPYPVDLSFLEENHSVFQVEAIKGHCVFYTGSKEQGNYEETVLRRAADFKPVLDLFLKEALEDI